MDTPEAATGSHEHVGGGRRGGRRVPNRVGGRDRRWAAMGAAWVAVLAYGWWFTDRQPFSRGAFLALVVGVALIIAGAVVRRPRAANTPTEPSTPHTPRFRSAAVTWSVLSVAVIAWELIALRSLPRAAHPTISSLVESAEQYHIARLALYAAWVWFGWTIAS
jgi:hypothetical protein